MTSAFSEEEVCVEGRTPSGVYKQIESHEPLREQSVYEIIICIQPTQLEAVFLI